MAPVIDLAAWRKLHGDDPVDRLERAMTRLDPLVEAVAARRSDRWLESEILAVQGAVSMGLVELAAERAERLADRLERAARRPG